MEAVRVRHISLPAEEQARNRDGKGWVQERGGRKEKKLKWEAGKDRWRRGEQCWFSWDRSGDGCSWYAESLNILFCGFLIHGTRRVATKSKVRHYKTNSGQQEKQTRNAFSIYTHRRRLGPPGFTQFVILHEESHAMLKKFGPVTAKQSEAFARVHERGRCWKHRSLRLTEDRRL